jgi:hypothetical protein
MLNIADKNVLDMTKAKLMEKEESNGEDNKKEMLVINILLPSMELQQPRSFRP